LFGDDPLDETAGNDQCQRDTWNMNTATGIEKRQPPYPQRYQQGQAHEKDCQRPDKIGGKPPRMN
jgi:hypothetical protein